MFEEAAQECQAALRLDPEAVEAQGLTRDIHRNWATTKCIQLLSDIAEIRGRVAEQTKHYETEQFAETAIHQCEAELNQAQAQLDEFRGWCAQNPDRHQLLMEREPELRQAETQLANLRGTAWAQKIWLWREQHHYWTAYQYFLRPPPRQNWI